MGPVEFSTATFGTADLAGRHGAAHDRYGSRRGSAGAGALERRQEHPEAVRAPGYPCTCGTRVAGRRRGRPPRCPRHRPWHTDEITAGLVIGCRVAEERNAALTQRLLRRLAQEDPRIPSWSVVDRAARNAGETGGTWLQEARRRHRQAGKLQAVPGRTARRPWPNRGDFGAGRGKARDCERLGRAERETAAPWIALEIPVDQRGPRRRPLNGKWHDDPRRSRPARRRHIRPRCFS